MANKLIVAPAPHVQTAQSTTRIMRDVVIALMPALVVSTVVFGLDVLRVTALSVVSCVVIEYLIQKFMVRGATTVGNWSAVVTGVLLAFNLPASIPWWISGASVTARNWKKATPMLLSPTRWNC